MPSAAGPVSRTRIASATVAYKIYCCRGIGWPPSAPNPAPTTEESLRPGGGGNSLTRRALRLRPSSETAQRVRLRAAQTLPNPDAIAPAILCRSPDRPIARSPDRPVAPGQEPAGPPAVARLADRKAVMPLFPRRGPLGAFGCGNGTGMPVVLVDRLNLYWLTNP